MVNHWRGATGVFGSVGKQDVTMFGCLLVTVLGGVGDQLGKKE